MSVSTHTTTSSVDSETYQCSNCGGDRLAHASVAGSFCSTECHRAHMRSKAASEILELLQNDHRFCYTCCQQLKDVDKPDKTVVVGPPQIGEHDWEVAKDVFIGLQTTRNEADHGERTVHGETPWVRSNVADRVRMGTICSCGNTDDWHQERIIQRLLGTTVADRLIEAVETLRAEDKIETEIDDRELREIVGSRPPVADPVRFALTEAVSLP